MGKAFKLLSTKVILMSILQNELNMDYEKENCTVRTYGAEKSLYNMISLFLAYVIC